VAAGVYLVARIFVLLTPGAQLFIACIGCITLAMAALIAIVQTDIKKVLAYSTLSQLGYMILGMGLGAWIGALFHLLKHAFFKALMFLGSGQVIEGCHHEQDMRKMGGLARKMPVTCWTFFIGVLAIAGAGIPMTHIGLGGFFSKDEILAVAWHRAYGKGHVESGHEAHAALPGPWADASGSTAIGHGMASADEHAAKQSSLAEMNTLATLGAPIYKVLFIVPLIIAYVTPFYMMRAWWMTFMGKPRDHHVHEHAHESPLMYVPLIVLAAGTFFSSYFLFRGMVADAHPNDFLVASFDGGHHAEHGVAIDHDAHTQLAKLVGGAFVVGFFLAFLIYRKGLELPARIAGALRPLYVVLDRKFFIDELYGAVLVGGVLVIKTVAALFDKLVVDGVVNLSAAITRGLATLSGRVIDAKVVDGAVNGVAQAAWELGGVLRTPQDGRIRNYVLYVAGAAAVALFIIIWPWRG